MRNDIAALLLRLTFGITFLVNGVSKFQMIDGIVGYFQSIGLPAFMAYTVAGIEVIGGIGIIVGLGTRYISIILAIIMLGAIIKVKFSAGFLGNGQIAGWELELLLLVIGVYFAVSGTRAISLDWIFANKRRLGSGQSA